MSEVTPEAVHQLIKNLLVEELDVDPEAVTADATLESLNVDSLDLVEVAQLVEERWDFEIKGADAKGVRTVGDAVAMIVKKADSVGLAESGALDAVQPSGGEQPAEVVA
ncbi:MAG TPA: acyl carrier protein [Thermoleophilaceae bacterium]|jgi:acyl carrier protein